MKGLVSFFLFNNQIRLGLKTYYGVKEKGYYKQGRIVGKPIETEHDRMNVFVRPEVQNKFMKKMGYKMYFP